MSLGMALPILIPFFSGIGPILAKISAGMVTASVATQQQNLALARQAY